MAVQEPMAVSQYKDIKHNIGNGKPTILAFGMSHCYSCIAMSKLFAEVLREHPEFQIYAIDGQKSASSAGISTNSKRFRHRRLSVK